MKIKKFRAKSFPEALEMVKKELSVDAVILASEEKRGMRPCVEITAAVDYDTAVPYRAAASPPSSAVRSLYHAGAESARAAAVPAAPERRAEPVAPRDAEADGVAREIRQLRAAVEDMRRNGFEISLPAGRKSVFRYLRERAVREEYALGMCERAADVKDLPSLLSADLKVRGQSGAARAVMVIGPTGVGKTTTVAKLAACSLREGRRVGIITLDTYRIGAVEQMRIYARIMGLPFSAVSSIRDLKETLREFSRGRDVVYIDTTGRNPRDQDYRDQLHAACETELPMEVHLLMSASSDDGFMTEAHRFYQVVPIDCIGFTKIDEAVRYGALYNLLRTYQKPVSYLTVGQKVPDDIMFPTVNNLVDLILKKGCHTC